MTEAELEYALQPGSGVGESFHAAGLESTVLAHGEAREPARYGPTDAAAD